MTRRSITTFAGAVSALGVLLAGPVVAPLSGQAMAIPKEGSGCAGAEANERRLYQRYERALMEDAPTATILASRDAWQKAYDAKLECERTPKVDSDRCIPRVRGVGSTRRGNGCD